MVERQIEAVDKQIDLLVYELYGSTDEEIRIVDSGSKNGGHGGKSVVSG